MIIVYSLVVHNATVNGAADNVPCVPSDLNKCPTTVSGTVADLLKSITEAIFAWAVDQVGENEDREEHYQIAKIANLKNDIGRQKSEWDELDMRKRYES